jgi:hypothetical protein
MTVDESVECQAGTKIESGDGISVVTGGALTYRAGDSIQIGNGFGMALGTTFVTEIDPSLLPE